jgi:alpha-L-fucosidase
MGLTPDPDGLLPEPDVQRLKEWGEEINRRFSNPLASTKGEGKVLELKLKESLPVNHVLIQEDIAKGERIRNYEIEGYSGGRWITLANGESIGNKRIEKFDTIKLSRLRIKIIDSDGLAQIKDFSAYFVAEKDFK